MPSPVPIAARARRAWAIALTALLAALILPAAAHAAPGWTAPQQLPDSTVSSTVAGAPDVKVDRAGNAVAVWGEGSFPSLTVKAATKPAGGAWSAPTALVAEHADTPLSGNAASVTVAPDGSATAVWKDSAIMSTGVWVATRPAGGSWGVPFNVSASAGTPTALSTAPRAVTDAEGNTTVLWQSGLSTLAATRPAGGSWGAPVDVFTTTSDDSNNLFGLAVDVAADGAVTAVFRVGKTSNFGIYAKTRATPTGSWSTLQEILGRGNTVNELQLAVSGAGSSTGEATVMWRDNSSVVKTSSRSATGNTWSAPADAGSGTGPRIAYDRHGNATAAWQGSAAVETMRRTAGAWGTVAAIPGAEGGTTPQIATGPDAEVHATWIASDGTAPVVHSARFAGGAWGTPVAVSDAGVATGAAGLAVGPIGDVDALWPVTGGDVRAATYGNERELGTDWTANGLPGSLDLRSWIRYIGGNANVTPSEGATRPDDNDPNSFRFGHTDAWVQAETGETVVANDGQVRFAYTGHYIDNRVVDPQFRIAADGQSGRVVADGQGSGDMAEAMNGNWQVDPYQGVHLLDLDVDAGTKVVSADGERITWVRVPAYITADGAPYLSYAAGTRYGFFTITAPAALEERGEEPVDPGPGPGTDPGPGPGTNPGPGPKVDPKPDTTKPKQLRATGKVTKTTKRGAATIKLDKQPGAKTGKAYRVQLVRKGKTIATGTVRGKTLKLSVRKVGKGKKARYPKLKGAYTLTGAKGAKGVTKTQLTVGK
jgi:hypothetical protein